VTSTIGQFVGTGAFGAYAFAFIPFSLYLKNRIYTSLLSRPMASTICQFCGADILDLSVILQGSVFGLFLGLFSFSLLSGISPNWPGRITVNRHTGHALLQELLSEVYYYTCI
jgi:hypothetical protein